MSAAYTIPERPAEVEALYWRILAQGKSAAEPVTTIRATSSGIPALADHEILALLANEKSGKASRLLAGDTSEYDGDESRADEAFVAKILFYTDDDAQVERIFEQSGLCREKWTNRADYRRRTIAAARPIVERGDRYGGKRSATGRPALVAVPLAASASHDELPCIVVNNRQLRDVSAETLEALTAGNDPPWLYVRDGTLVRTRFDEHGRPVIQVLTETMLRSRCTACADFVRTHERGVTSVAPPLDVVRDVLARADYPFPPLEAVVETPILRRDGSLVDRPGYDPTTAVIYAPAPGLEVPEIPAHPSDTDVANAVATLDEGIGEFPYADDPSRAGAYAPIITSVCRTAIDGPTPLGLVDAPQAGTGKSLFAGVVAVIATGREAAVLSPPDNDEELKKLITAELVDGATLFVFDNLDRPLWAPSLARAITASTWKDRVLGRSEVATLPVRAAWLLTGNNVRLRGDIPRRSYWIRLDAKTARPWERTGFRHPDLILWAKANRGRLIAAVLTLARAWFAAGCPAPTSPKIGGFEEWSRVVGGILEHAGVRGFLGNLAELYDEADEEAAQWEGFLEVLGEVYPAEGFTVAQIVADLKDRSRVLEVLPDDLATFNPSDDPGKIASFQRRLGKALGKRSGTRYGATGLHLEKAGVRHKVIVWRIGSNAAPQTEPPQGGPDAGGMDGGLTGLGGFIFPNAGEIQESSYSNRAENNPPNTQTPTCGGCSRPLEDCLCTS
jgi:hypothetical protein